MLFLLDVYCILSVISFDISATEYHLGLLKAKLAKYRQQLLEPTGKSGAKVRKVLFLQVKKRYSQQFGVSFLY